MLQLEVMTISFIIAIQIFIKIEIIENLIKIFEVFSQDKFFLLDSKNSKMIGASHSYLGGWCFSLVLFGYDSCQILSF